MASGRARASGSDGGDPQAALCHTSPASLATANSLLTLIASTSLSPGAQATAPRLTPPTANVMLLTGLILALLPGTLPPAVQLADPDALAIHEPGAAAPATGASLSLGANES